MFAKTDTMSKSTVQINLLKVFSSAILATVIYGVFIQFVLLFVFLLFVNFHIMHPLQWLVQSLGAMWSFRTLLSLAPLIMTVLLYESALFRRLMAGKRYHATRCGRLLVPLLPKAIFLLLHALVGLLMAWLYVGFLHIDYSNSTYECYGSSCLNSRYMFVMYAGVAASCYHYAEEYACQQPEVEFPLIEQSRWVQLRSAIYNTLHKLLMQTPLPTLCLVAGYAFLGLRLNAFWAYCFGLNLDDSAYTLLELVFDVRLLFYSWLLVTIVLSNLQLLQRCFAITLSDQMHLPITQTLANDCFGELTLTQAIALVEAPVLQQLAARQLYYIANDPARAAERQEIFALTRLSDHPFNWHQLNNQCLSLIDNYTEQLALAVKNISNIKLSPLCVPLARVDHANASEMAQKVLLQQHETLRVRRLLVDPYPQKTQARSAESLLERLQLRNLNLSSFWTLLCRMPGVFYLFGEPESARTAHLLSNSQDIIWLTQGLSGLCAISLMEDRYGVVQESLPAVFKTLLKLKLELDKLHNVNLNGKKLDRNLITLKNAVKRSLYKMCSAFGDYLSEMVVEPQELRHLQCFVSYQET